MSKSRILLDTLTSNPDCKIFYILDSEGEIPTWKVEPTNLDLIPQGEGHFLVKSIVVDKNKKETIGYINLSTPERIADYVFFDLSDPKYCYTYELTDDDVIPAVASDCFGLYELFYSKNNPETGLNILKKGLQISKQKSVIAEDIGYILRDENRLEEALEYFLISEKHEPSSEYIFGEIEDIYTALGNKTKAQEYKTKYEQH